MTPNNDLLEKIRAVSLSKAAEALDVHIRTVRRLIADGEFPATFKVGASTRVLVVDLERFIERQRRAGVR